MAEAPRRLRISINLPDEIAFQGEADFVVAPAADGEVGILPRHAPLIALLRPGRVRIQQGQTTHRFQIQGGFLEVRENRLTILTEEAKGL